MTTPPKSQHFNYLFLGMGAGNSLLLIQLDRQGLLDGKSIGIIDPDLKNRNDRTFCFWATDEEVAFLGLHALISKTWNEVQVGNAAPQSITPYRYHHVSGIHLYNHARAILQQHAHSWFYESFQGSGTASLFADGAAISADQVFDSRPPHYRKPRIHESYLHQSFIGWNITTEVPVFEANRFVMMDFSIPQQESTQFMYVLPFDACHALVECTRFGNEEIQESDAAIILHEYISRHYGAYVVHDVERGNIPMCSAAIERAEVPTPWVATGARAGNLKPSTGYSFLNACQHAAVIAGRAVPGVKKSRYAFYDRLLLKILETQPFQGKRIFEQLFQKVPIPRVLGFLSEAASFGEEVFILSRLPKRLFMAAALRDFWWRMKNYRLLPWLLFGMLWMLYGLGMEAGGLGLLTLGFLLVGLPHGAIDHLLETGNLRTPIRPLFILKYLSISACMGALWLLNPNLGLWVFLAYSAWHFGETEFNSQGRKTGFLSFIWGSSMLGLILFTHITELNEVLRELNISELPESLQWLSWLFAATYLLTGGVSGLTGLYLFPALMLPLLHTFGLYFVADHSVKSSVHLFRSFQAKPAELYRKAIPFTLGALLLGGLCYWGGFGETEGATGLFFIFLSCLSFPHVLAMHHFYRNSAPTNRENMAAS
jgi:lycopene beta-cyclase